MYVQKRNPFKKVKPTKFIKYGKIITGNISKE